MLEINRLYDVKFNIITENCYAIIARRSRGGWGEVPPQEEKLHKSSIQYIHTLLHN